MTANQASENVVGVSASDAVRLALVRDELYTAVVGDVLDQIGRCHQFLPARLRPLQPALVMAGRAMPVLLSDVFGPQEKPFGRLTEALDQLEPNEVYLATGGRAECAAWGEILTATARARGAAGAVVDAYHRDTHKVLDQGWPVFSCGAYAQDAAVRAQVRDYRLSVEVGGVAVSPGDLVIGDVDGVLVVPRDVEEEVLERALSKARAENTVRTAIENGMSSTEAFRRYGVL